jgi:hypothetical protein
MLKGNSLTLSSLELLCLAGASDTTIEPTEGDDLLVLLHVTEIRVSLGELQACFRNTSEFFGNVTNE